MEPILDFLLGSEQCKLLFCWVSYFLKIVFLCSTYFIHTFSVESSGVFIVLLRLISIMLSSFCVLVLLLVSEKHVYEKHYTEARLETFVHLRYIRYPISCPIYRSNGI